MFVFDLIGMFVRFDCKIFFGDDEKCIVEYRVVNYADKIALFIFVVIFESF